MSLLNCKAGRTVQTSLFTWGLELSSPPHGAAAPEVHGASASQQQAAEAEPDSFMPAAAGGVAAAGGAATTAAADVLADADPCGPEQRPSFVDVLLFANDALQEPLVAWELKQPGEIPVSPGRPAPDAVACWNTRKEGGALSFWMLPTALQQSCPSML